MEPVCDVDATPVMTSETTSGITVIRIALTHNEPTGAMASTAPRSVELCVAATISPMARPRPRPTRTRVPSFNRGSLHHQVAAVDIQRRTGDVRRAFGGGKTDQISDFERSAEAGHWIALGQPIELLRWRAFSRDVRVDHALTHSRH